MHSIYRINVNKQFPCHSLLFRKYKLIIPHTEASVQNKMPCIVIALLLDTLFFHRKRPRFLISFLFSSDKYNNKRSLLFFCLCSISVLLILCDPTDFEYLSFPFSVSICKILFSAITVPVRSPSPVHLMHPLLNGIALHPASRLCLPDLPEEFRCHRFRMRKTYRTE